MSSVVCESESEDMDTSDLLPLTSATAPSSASAPTLTSATVDRPAGRQQLSQETQTGSDLLAAAAAERVQTGSESGGSSGSGGGGGGPKWELLPREMLGR